MHWRDMIPGYLVRQWLPQLSAHMVKIDPQGGQSALPSGPIKRWATAANRSFAKIRTGQRLERLLAIRSHLT
jgi:hypothetical protein